MNIASAWTVTLEALLKERSQGCLNEVFVGDSKAGIHQDLSCQKLREFPKITKGIPKGFWNQLKEAASGQTKNNLSFIKK